mgnify:CR=1 FL=1
MTTGSELKYKIDHMQSLIGTGVAVVTPFAVNKEVDFPSLKKVIHHLIKGGVEYLVVMGTTGEAATLSKAEERKVIDFFFEEVEGKLPIVLGIGGNDTKRVGEKITEFSGIYKETEAILSVSPYYNKPSQEGIYQHYASLASSTDLPLILYNVPGRTSSNISAETTLKLAYDFANVVATKEASGNIAQIMEIIKGKNEDFLVLSGDDNMSLPMISLGGSGTISVSANAFPLRFSEMVRAALNGDWAKARELNYQLLPMMKLHFQEGNPSGVKMAMALQGLCEPQVRLPLVKATEGLKAQISAHLAPMIGK